jgi:hypothetical protein
MTSNNNIKVRIAVLSILAVLVFLFVGCASIIGLGVGLVVDNDKRGNPPNISMGSIKGFEPGTTIIIREKNGIETQGQYLGFARNVNSDSYLMQQQTLADSMEIFMPSFGETIIVTDTSGAKATYRFLGFHYHSVANDWIPRMAIGSNTDSVTDNINIYSIKELQIGDSHSISKAQIMSFVGGGGLPQSSAIFVKDSSGVNGIPVDGVANIRMPKVKPGSYALRGLIIGICIDFIVVAGIFYWLSTNPPNFD